MPLAWCLAQRRHLRFEGAVSPTLQRTRTVNQMTAAAHTLCADIFPQTPITSQHAGNVKSAIAKHVVADDRGVCRHRNLVEFGDKLAHLGNFGKIELGLVAEEIFNRDSHLFESCIAAPMT